MSTKLGLKLLHQAQQPDSLHGEKTIKPELADALKQLEAADPETGKPAGQFAPEVLEALEKLEATARGMKSGSVRRMLPGLLDRVRGNLWTDGTGGTGGTGGTPGPVLDIQVRDGHQVFLTGDRGFAIDADGAAPASAKAMGNTLFHAGEWVQASFGQRDNLFKRPGFDTNSGKAVVEQFTAQLDADLSALEQPQQQQLLGSIAGLTVELIKSLDLHIPLAGAQTERRELRDQAFALLDRSLGDPRMSALIKRQLVGYLNDADSFKNQLSGPQKAKITERYEALNPKTPFDYDKWERQGKDTINVHHIAGHGEGFLYGITKHLMEDGLNSRATSWQVTPGDLKMRLVEGENQGDHAPRTLEVTVPANHEWNAWGRDMTVRMEASMFRDNMLEGLGREDIDITGYDGHSGFGRNTLKSMRDAPEQQGDKLFYRLVCAGVDAENAIAHHAPEAYANSYTTQDSSYFWKSRGADKMPDGGVYTKRSEGWEAIKVMIEGVLGKKDHAWIQEEMRTEANMTAHSPGNTNNFIGPGDARHGGAGDWDNDGVPNMYDVMPTVNTFDIAASISKEFDLRIPDVDANELAGGRAFQAVQFVNTATNYSTLLKKHNLNRRITPNPDGIWFNGGDDPKSYVKFDRAADGAIHVQFNSALSDMTMETLRAVLFYETSNFLLQDDLGRNPAELTAANLMFAAASLEYDMAWRDQPVFDGLKDLYAIPASVDFRSVDRAVADAGDAHDYTGNRAALNTVLGDHRAALQGAGVGQPAKAAYA